MQLSGVHLSVCLSPPYAVRRCCRFAAVHLSGVHLSVCLSVPSVRRTLLLQVCCCAPGGRRWISCGSSGTRMRAVTRCQHTQVDEHRLVTEGSVPERVVEENGGVIAA